MKDPNYVAWMKERHPEAIAGGSVAVSSCETGKSSPPFMHMHMYTISLVLTGLRIMYALYFSAAVSGQLATDVSDILTLPKPVVKSTN